MSWMCEPVERAVIVHYAHCGSCGWERRARDRTHAAIMCDVHRRRHDEIWEASDGTDTGDYLRDGDTP